MAELDKLITPLHWHRAGMSFRDSHGSSEIGIQIRSTEALMVGASAEEAENFRCHLDGLRGLQFEPADAVHETILHQFGPLDEKKTPLIPSMFRQLCPTCNRISCGCEKQVEEIQEIAKPQDGTYSADRFECDTTFEGGAAFHLFLGSVHMFFNMRREDARKVLSACLEELESGKVKSYQHFEVD